MRGGKREGAGRKVGYRKELALKKNNRLVILCTDDELLQIKSKAKEADMPVSMYYKRR